MTSPAVTRGQELFFKVAIEDLPSEAFVYAGYLCIKYGMCSEVMLTAYCHYAQIVEGLECDDDLYSVDSEYRSFWETAQKTYVRKKLPNGRLTIEKI